MKKAAKKTPATIDAYLAGVEPGQRAALERLRKTIRAAVPEAEECISYQMPAFRYEGKVFAWFAAAKNHLSFYPGGVLEDVAGDLAGFETSKGTIRFQPDRPLPAALVKKLVKARIARNAASASKRTT